MQTTDTVCGRNVKIRIKIKTCLSKGINESTVFLVARLKLCHPLITWQWLSPLAANPVNITKCRSIWPNTRLLWWSKANIEKTSALKTRRSQVEVFFNYLSVYQWLHCVQHSLVSTAPQGVGLITLVFAPTGALTAHSVLPIGIFGFQGHCLQFALAWQIQSKTTRSVKSRTINGFSVMLNKPKGRRGRGVGKYTDSLRCLHLESYTGTL